MLHANVCGLLSPLYSGVFCAILPLSLVSSVTLFFLKNRIHCFNLVTKYANPFGVNKILTKSQVQLNFIFPTSKKSVVDSNFNPPLTLIQFPAISTFLSLITANSLCARLQGFWPTFTPCERALFHVSV